MKEGKRGGRNRVLFVAQTREPPCCYTHTPTEPPDGPISDRKRPVRWSDLLVPFCSAVWGARETLSLRFKEEQHHQTKCLTFTRFRVKTLWHRVHMFLVSVCSNLM